ncbi:hypothetical protein, partial [Paraburkholderia tuberum]|uniref:hypothetical protein n=1 Tax=Paraburkholderia tuberum TaxID=157910 RepID=UPI001ABC2A68
MSWSISAEWFAVLFLFSLCARVLSRLSRVTFGVIVLVCWLTLCGKHLTTTVVDDGEKRHQSGAHHFRFDGHHCD